MQIFFWPTWLMLLSYIIYWPVIQLLIAIIGNHVNDKHFHPDSFWLKTRTWEKGGEIYNHVFKIRKWKHLLPDGARAHKKGFQKKHMNNFSSNYMEAFIAETGRAETIHWLQIFPFWIIGFWSPPYIVWIMLAYALIVNFPCILAQRYNRPRLRKIYNEKKQRH